MISLVIFLLNQEIKVSILLEMTGMNFRIPPFSAIQIDPARPFDRPTRILIKDKTGKGYPG